MEQSDTKTITGNCTFLIRFAEHNHSPKQDKTMEEKQRCSTTWKWVSLLYRNDWLPVLMYQENEISWTKKYLYSIYLFSLSYKQNTEIVGVPSWKYGFLYKKLHPCSLVGHSIRYSVFIYMPINKTTGQVGWSTHTVREINKIKRNKYDHTPMLLVDKNPGQD